MVVGLMEELAVVDTGDHVGCFYFSLTWINCHRKEETCYWKKWLLNPASGRSTERLACTCRTMYLRTPVPQLVSDLLFGSRGREVTDYWVTRDLLQGMQAL